MEFFVKLFAQDKADGVYVLQAQKCTAAILFWANEKGALPDWTSFAYIPLDSCGRGRFHFQGGRSVPPEATHVYVRAVHDDFIGYEEGLYEMPINGRRRLVQEEVHLCVMSDLHLSSKTGVLKRAFAMAQGADALLLAGDMTNDGTTRQHELLKQCLEELLPDMQVFSVTGNHDVPRTAEEQGDRHEIWNHLMFQRWLFERMEKGEWQYGPDGAYAASFGDIEIIGLQAVTEKRKFLFEGGKQLEWLNRLLSKTPKARWRIILCHAPLLQHNPKREEGKSPYLNRDKQLQEIVDRHGKIIFISGHTHLSMNNPTGCVEWDAVSSNLYINDASIRPTDLLPGEQMQPAEWKDGTFLDIRISGLDVEIVTRSVSSGKKHARGYYHFILS